MNLIGTFGYGDSETVVLYDGNIKYIVTRLKFKQNFKKYKFNSIKTGYKYKLNVNKLKFNKIQINNFKFNVKIIQLKFKKDDECH